MSTNAAPEPESHDAAPARASESRSRDGRIEVIVEAFLRQVHDGGSLDPEPYLAGAEALRDELVPLLTNVLRLEMVARALRENEVKGRDVPAVDSDVRRLDSET